jgi:hypothetical protein
MRKILVVMALAASACSSVGRPLPLNSLRTLEPGKSTPADAVALLGQPYAVATSATKATTYVWTYSHASAFGGAYAESVRLKFDDKGVLVAVPNPPPNREQREN